MEGREPWIALNALIVYDGRIEIVKGEEDRIGNDEHSIYLLRYSKVLIKKSLWKHERVCSPTND